MEGHQSPPLSPSNHVKPKNPEPAASSSVRARYSSPIAHRTQSHTKQLKPWIAKAELYTGRSRGASTCGVQHKVRKWLSTETEQYVGEWLGLFIRMPVESADILTVDELIYVALALQHNKLYNLAPCTEPQYEELRTTQISLLEAKLAVAEGQMERQEDILRCTDHLELGCECDLHTLLRGGESDLDFADWLGRVMGNASELQGAMYSGNLGNIAVELVKLILERAGFQHLQIQSEGKSKTCGVASKVTYIFGNEDEALCVEGTPDFYVRTTHPFHPKIVYLLIGECESQGSDYPETQLAITTLGHLIDPTNNVIAATLFMKSPLSATVYLGTAERVDGKIFVKFRSVNSNRGYHLMAQAQLGAFSNTLVTVVRHIMK